MSEGKDGYPQGFRAATSEDVPKLGPWFTVGRAFLGNKPYDTGEIVSASIFRDVERRKTFAPDAVALPEILRVGMACETCSAVFMHPITAAAHQRFRHGDDAVRRQDAETARQRQRDEADERGRVASVEKYKSENRSCWCCGSSLRPFHRLALENPPASVKPWTAGDTGRAMTSVEALPNQPPPPAA